MSTFIEDKINNNVNGISGACKKTAHHDIPCERCKRVYTMSNYVSAQGQARIWLVKNGSSNTIECSFTLWRLHGMDEWEVQIGPQYGDESERVEPQTSHAYAAYYMPMHPHVERKERASVYNTGVSYTKYVSDGRCDCIDQFKSLIS